MSTGAVAEAIEGLRVRATGTIVEAPTGFADGLGLLLDDGTGEIRAIVMPAALGTAGPIRGDRATVVGVVGQRDSSGTGSAGYRLTVAGTGDLTLERVPAPSPTPTLGPSPTALPSGDPSPAPTLGPSPSATPIPSAGPTDPPGPIPTISPSSAPSPSGPPVSTVPPIATVRGAALGSTVTVDGFVILEPGRTGSSALLALGDGSGGIFVRLPSGIAAPSRGAHLLVSGTLADPYGQLEIRVALGGIVPATGGANAPMPAAMGAADLGESTEGRLGTLTGTIDGSPTRTATGLAAWLVDAAGGRARILVAGASGIVGTDLRSGARYRLTGVVGQRASHKGALDGYRLWLRDRGDVTLISSPPASSGSSPTPNPGSGTPAGVTIARAIPLKDRIVSVVGVSTIPATLLDTSGRRIVIQDGTGAIEVRLPAGMHAPSIGRRLRVVGKVGRAYDAPRIVASTVTDLGAGAMPAPRTLSGGPGIAVEWRLVRVAGTIVDVHKLGIGGGRSSGSARLGRDQRAGRRPHPVVDARRRPPGDDRRDRAAAYPGAADRRFAVVPRSSADVAVSSAGSSGGNGATSRGNGTATGAGAPGRERATGPDDDGPLSAPTAELGGLDALVGQRVRVGGLVVQLTVDGFVLDDGTATGRIVLAGEAATYLGLIEPTDAIEVVGRVVLDEAGPRLVVEAGADVLRVGGLGASVEPEASGAASSASTIPSVADPSSGTVARSAGLGGLPDLTVAGAGWLALVMGLSVAVTLARRRRTRRALAARIAARLAAVAGPRAVPLSVAHAQPNLTLARTHDYARPSFAPAKRFRGERDGLAERGSPRRNTRIADRDPRENGSTTSHSAPASWPSTSSSPVTQNGPPGSPRASTRSSSSAVTGSSSPSPARIAANGFPSCRPGSARTTSRSWWPRSWRSRNVRPSSGSVPAARSSRRSASGDLIIIDRRGPSRGDHELLRPRWVSRDRRLRGGRGTRRGRGEARPPGPRRGDGDGAGVLRGARATHPAAAHPLP